MQKDTVENIAGDIISTGVGFADAIHVACAVVAACQFFITTDKRLLKYKRNDITIISPIDFIQMIGDEEDVK